MIEVIDLSVEIGGQAILRDVNLDIGMGNVFALLGPSGSGKTTLLRVIAGLHKPTRGEVRLDGLRVSTPTEILSPAKRNLSMVFQSLALWPHMTVRKNVEFVMDRKRHRTKREVSERIEQLLSTIRLSEMKDRYPGELSGGERQRLAIARALATEPIYLLMDEPFSDLDDLLKEELMKLTMELKESNNMTVVYVTHNVEEALFLGDKVAVINKGVIKKVWESEEVKLLTKKKVLENYR